MEKAPTNASATTTHLMTVPMRELRGTAAGRWDVPSNSSCSSSAVSPVTSVIAEEVFRGIYDMLQV